MDKTCYIMVGPPASGKSTFARKLNLPILSCDQLRIDFFGKDYKFSKEKEEIIWDCFYERIKLFNDSFVIDNTNCRKVYIDRILEILPKHFEVEYVLFDKPLWLLYIRNYWRWLWTGKFVPNDVIRNMQKNFRNECKNYIKSKIKY